MSYWEQLGLVGGADEVTDEVVYYDVTFNPPTPTSSAGSFTVVYNQPNPPAEALPAYSPSNLPAYSPATTTLPAISFGPPVSFGSIVPYGPPTAQQHASTLINDMLRISNQWLTIMCNCKILATKLALLRYIANEQKIHVAYLAKGVLSLRTTRDLIASASTIENLVAGTPTTKDTSTPENASTTPKFLASGGAGWAFFPSPTELEFKRASDRLVDKLAKVKKAEAELERLEAKVAMHRDKHGVMQSQLRALRESLVQQGGAAVFGDGIERECDRLSAGMAKLATRRTARMEVVDARVEKLRKTLLELERKRKGVRGEREGEGEGEVAAAVPGK